MKTRLGLWIDHRQAVVVALSDEGEKTWRILSGAERQQRRTGDAQMKTSQKPRHTIADDIQMRTYIGQLNRYYDEVIAAVAAADAILLFGPGEAKGELKRRLEKKGLGSRIAAVETADKMSDQQIAAKVRDRFLPRRRSARSPVRSGRGARG